MKKVKVNYEKLYYGFPVILLSYYDKDGIPNVTTISSSYTLKDMVALGFSCGGYAINQIKEVSDFVINIVDSKLVQEAEFCGKNTGSVCKKFESLNLTPIPSEVVNAPIIDECPISIECTLTDVFESQNHKGITNILASIKGRVISESYIDEKGRIKVSEFDNILYIGDGVNRGYRYMKKE
ncbi:flavin reductase family protein [[Clostridium] fimetarium]|uniref:NADH-FMN oxidoreductase RutF, flavin reductase (DIM6/NTAB) family n=1 Tax=[Clostridium] fimetarium TaxID=99656 RepID=A0A1I0RPC8_9FIRM|nr:flavin reductase [[Clostridium] fimetarium]SEW43106.1 NADH-FMN oxidoreductase RutF, flavin reductase (DIM6/NTAB) family [[Clostridium] fimetarium]